jgi:hypothetical protein
MEADYKKRVRRRTIRRNLTVFFTLLFFNVIFSIGCIYLLLFLVVTCIPLFYMAYRIAQINKYEYCIGTIKDINIENFYKDPYTIAIISYKIGRKNYKTTWPITRFGDYEEGLEDEIMKMLEDDKKYIGYRIPILYSKKKNDNVLIYMEDAYKEKNGKKKD